MKVTNDHGIELKHWKEVVSNDSLRPVKTGIYFDLKNSCMVATNSHILLECPCGIEWTKEELAAKGEYREVVLEEQSKIVPIEFFDKKKYMGDFRQYSFEIKYDFSDEDYAQVWHGPEVVFRCRYIGGRYPNYKAVYPKEQSHIESIGVDVGMANRIFKAIPFPNPYKGLHFKFFAKNRGLVFHSNKEQLFKGIIMPIIG